MPLNELATLKTRLKELTAQIRSLETERWKVRENITLERARLQLEQERSDAAMAPQIVARWDAGMDPSDIAAALKLKNNDVLRILAAWREQHNVTVRRQQRPIPERRRVHRS